MAIQAVRFAAAVSLSESLRKNRAVSGDCPQPHCLNNPAGSPAHPGCHAEDVMPGPSRSVRGVAPGDSPRPLPQ